MSGGSSATLVRMFALPGLCYRFLGCTDRSPAVASFEGENSETRSGPLVRYCAPRYFTYMYS